MEQAFGEAIVSPWGGDPTLHLKRFMLGKYCHRTNRAPSFAKSPALGRG